MSHTFSMKWVSDTTKEKDAHKATINALRRYLGRHKPSPCIPWTFQDWVNHRIQVQNDRINVKTHAKDMFRLKKESPKLTCSALKNKKFSRDQLGAVFAVETAFTPQYDWDYRADASLWPSTEEWEFEGTGRARTGFGRKLPLMRKRLGADSGTSWKNLDIVRPLEFDDLDQPPPLRDANERWSQEISDAQGVECLGRDLFATVSGDAIYYI